MTSCSRGDVVLVKFVFADEKGAKQRPGLIVSIHWRHGFNWASRVESRSLELNLQVAG